MVQNAECRASRANEKNFKKLDWCWYTDSTGVQTRVQILESENSRRVLVMKILNLQSKYLNTNELHMAIN